MSDNYPKKPLKLDPETILSKSKDNWDYFGDTGPDFWYKLHPSFMVSKTGKEQSPVNIIKNETRKLRFVDIPQYNYLYSRYQLLNNKYFMRIEAMTPYNYIKLDNCLYYLQHIDIHTPSEHWIDGNNFPLELEFCHKNNKDEIAIISVFGIEGKENKILAEAISKSSQVAKSKKKINLNKKFNAHDLIPKRSSIYRYRGSLTTPPTNENVRWIIYDSPISFSKVQIDDYRKSFHYSSRPIQPLNLRFVFAYHPSLFKIIV